MDGRIPSSNRRAGLVAAVPKANGLLEPASGPGWKCSFGVTLEAFDKGAKLLAEDFLRVIWRPLIVNGSLKGTCPCCLASLLASFRGELDLPKEISLMLMDSTGPCLVALVDQHPMQVIARTITTHDFWTNLCQIHSDAPCCQKSQSSNADM